jgi:predicted nucleic acid-binding protein
MRLFFDASAFVKRYVDEPGSAAVESLCCAAHTIAISIVCPVEILSAILRLQREGRIQTRQYDRIKSALFADIQDVYLIQIEKEIIQNAITSIELSPLKALDSIHIGCALTWRPDFFVSSDIQQIAAAKKTGLTVRHI